MPEPMRASTSATARCAAGRAPRRPTRARRILRAGAHLPAAPSIVPLFLHAHALFAWAAAAARTATLLNARGRHLDGAVARSCSMAVPTSGHRPHLGGCGLITTGATSSSLHRRAVVPGCRGARRSRTSCTRARQGVAQRAARARARQRQRRAQRHGRRRAQQQRQQRPPRICASRTSSTRRTRSSTCPTPASASATSAIATR